LEVLQCSTVVSFEGTSLIIYYRFNSIIRICTCCI